MKTLILTSALIISAYCCLAQFDQFNLDFEEWEIDSLASTGVPQQLYNYPDILSFDPMRGTPSGWSMHGVILRTSDAYSGEYAAIIPVFYGALSSRIAIGAGCSAWEVLHSRCKIFYPSRIIRIQGYYKYISEGIGFAKAYFYALRNNQDSGGLDTIGMAAYIFEHTETYRHFEIPVVYFDEHDEQESNEIGAIDSVILAFISTLEQGESCDFSYCNFLYIDNLSFDIVSSTDEGPEADPFNSIDVFPNPGYGALQISAGDMPYGIYHVELCDIFGRVVHMDTTTGFPVTMDIHGVAKGVYFLVLSNEGGDKVVRKVMIGM